MDSKLVLIIFTFLTIDLVLSVNGYRGSRRIGQTSGRDYDYGGRPSYRERNHRVRPYDDYQDDYYQEGARGYGPTPRGDSGSIRYMQGGCVKAGGKCDEFKQQYCCGNMICSASFRCGKDSRW